MMTPYQVPGVYAQRRPRKADEPAVRTDVVGFIGFDPRVPGDSPPPARADSSAPAPVRCEDYRDYVFAFGEPKDDGTLLGPAVRAFFANGGRRCWVATVRGPQFDNPSDRKRALQDMVGIAGAGEREATGLERLLLVPEVTVIDAPDLYACRVEATRKAVALPPLDREARFFPCRDAHAPGVIMADGRAAAPASIFTSTPVWSGNPTGETSEVFETQRAMVARAVRERWRVLLLLSVPLLPDGGSGPHVVPTDRDAEEWLAQFDHLVKRAGFADTEEMGCAAMYWPWVLYQEQVGAPVLRMPPSPYAAGIIARRDLARGPQVSPANETLKQVVGLAPPAGDAMHGRLYSPEQDTSGREVPSVNVLRAFPGDGIQIWGARTLSTDRWLRYISVRRTLTAVELRIKASLDRLAFEPNTPMLWLQAIQAALGVLFPLFESGALRGDRPEEAFYVRCDATLNPPEALAEGRLLLEVGVAVAAPAEFIVFRAGRREGVVEVVE